MTIIIGTLLAIIISFELVLFLYYLINKDIKSESKMVIIFNLIIIIFLLLYLRSDLFNNIINTHDLFIFILAIFSSMILKLIFNNNELQKKYNRIIKCVIEYEKTIDEQGEKNHEYNNQLIVLKGYINDKKKLNEYLDSIILDHKTGQNYEIRQLASFPNGGLKELLYYKISRIKEYNIKYYLYVSKETSELLNNIKLSFYIDITKVLGVLIDNAIDASLDSKEKELSLDFSSEGNQIIITISNTYNKKINIKNIGKDRFSSKGKGHGFGLKLVKNIINNNKNLELITEHNKKHFIQTLIIYL